MAELSDKKIHAGWEQTFSTNNPFCPCDLKSFTKAVRWAERALATPAPAQPDPLHVANERGEGWQPIESVPKSPVPVLLFTRGGIVRIETGWYAVNLLAEAIENGEECAFTHWAPLPAAPKEKP